MFAPVFALGIGVLWLATRSHNEYADGRRVGIMDDPPKNAEDIPLPYDDFDPRPPEQEIWERIEEGEEDEHEYEYEDEYPEYDLDRLVNEYIPQEHRKYMPGGELHYDDPNRQVGTEWIQSLDDGDLYDNLIINLMAVDSEIPPEVVENLDRTQAEELLFRLERPGHPTWQQLEMEGHDTSGYNHQAGYESQAARRYKNTI